MGSLLSPTHPSFLPWEPWEASFSPGGQAPEVVCGVWYPLAGKKRSTSSLDPRGSGSQDWSQLLPLLMRVAPQELLHAQARLHLLWCNSRNTPVTVGIVVTTPQTQSGRPGETTFHGGARSQPLLLRGGSQHPQAGLLRRSRPARWAQRWTGPEADETQALPWHVPILDLAGPSMQSRGHMF